MIILIINNFDIFIKINIIKQIINLKILIIFLKFINIFKLNQKYKNEFVQLDNNSIPDLLYLFKIILKKNIIQKQFFYIVIY